MFFHRPYAAAACTAGWLVSGPVACAASIGATLGYAGTRVQGGSPAEGIVGAGVGGVAGAAGGAAGGYAASSLGVTSVASASITELAVVGAAAGLGAGTVQGAAAMGLHGADFDEALEIEREWNKRSQIPGYLVDLLKSMPEDTAPMTLFSQAILSL